MELINGEPLLAYCDRHRLSVRRRLELFQQICNAVQHAHQNLIVHRDLKPSNILVDASGSPKLLDFGIAKPLDTADEALTRTGVMPITPAYAAPEQLSGGTISTATDIYALGVVLYELLSGRRPFEPLPSETTFMDAMLNSDPERPSTRLTHEPPRDPAIHAMPSGDAISRARSTELPALRQLLRGDLDTICLMALRRDPAGRYVSAAALAGDVRAFLHQQPVSARPQTLRYQTAKFVRRNRLPVTVTALASLLLVAGSIVYTQRITAERDRAVLEQARTAEVVDFVTGLFAQSDPSMARGEEVTARELLAAGLRDVNARLGNRPAIRGKMLEVLGSVYRELGDFERALELLNGAVEDLEQAADADPLDLATARFALGIAEQDSGNYERATALMAAARATREAELGARDPLVREIIGAQGYLAETLGDFEKGERLQRESVAIARANAQGGDYEPLAIALKERAGVLRLLDRAHEAEPLLREALAMQERLYGGPHPEAADTKRQLAGVLRDTARYAEAKDLYREVIATRTRMLGEDHREVQHTWNSYAQLLDATGDHKGALEAFHRVRESLDRVRRGKPHVSLPALHHNIAFVLRNLERFEEAEQGYLAAIDAQDAIGMGADHPNRTYPLAALGQLYLEWGRLDKAEPRLRSVLATRRQHFDEDHRLVNEVKGDLGATLTGLGRYEEAEALLLSAYDAFAAKRSAHHPNLQAVRFRLRELYKATGQPERVAAYADPPSADAGP